MLSVVTLDDSTGSPVVLHSDDPGSKRNLTSALGLRGIATLRTSERVRPQAHGGINETRYEDGRTITLVGEIISQVSLEDVFAEWAQVGAAMMQTLDNGPALIKWTEGETGNELQRLVSLYGDFEPTFQEGASVLDYQAILFAEDPRAYSQALTTETSSPLSALGGGLVLDAPFPWMFSSSGGGTVSFTNDGNRDTPPVFEIIGQCVNPQIVVLETGARLSINGTVDPGNTLVLDAAARTVTLGDGTNRLNFYDSADSSWFNLPPGTSNLQLVAASFDGNALLRVSGRSAYA